MRYPKVSHYKLQFDLISFPQTASLMYAGAVLSLLLLFTFYIPMTMLIAYCIAFLFNSFSTAQTVMPNLFSFVSTYLFVKLLV